MRIPVSQITGLILAGGQGRRMSGQDKGLLELNEASLVQHAIHILEKQVDTIMISANRNIDRYEQFGLPVVKDRQEGFQGPLAGIFAAIQLVETDFLLTIPCDMPGLPADLATRMTQAMEQNHARACCVHDGVRLQPAVNILHKDLKSELENFLNTGQRKLQSFLEQVASVPVDFSDNYNAFANINTPDELQKFRNNTGASV
jgi:molybdenum cofactor guanylyltransferase